LSGTEEENRPLVSIIVNCYNGEKYLREAIDSVLSQTYKNWELIFWDNQSDDNSGTIFREYKDLRLHYCYAPKHTRLYEARNYAYEKSKGDFITFLDVDDWWEANKLEEQIKLFSEQSVGLVYSNFWIANTTTKDTKLAYKHPLPSGKVLNKILKKYTVGMLTIMVRRSSLKGLDYVFDSRFQMIGDFDLVTRVAIEWKFASIQEPLAYYRDHDNNMTKKHRNLQNNEMKQWLAESNSDERISNNDGYKARENLLLYSQGIEALDKNQKLVALKILWKIAFDLKIKLMVRMAVPKSVSKYIGLR